MKTSILSRPFAAIALSLCCCSGPVTPVGTGGSGNSGGSGGSTGGTGGSSACVTSDISSGQYLYLVNAWGGGGYCTWFDNLNSWGARGNVNSGSIVGYPSLARGCHWSACSANSGLPRQLATLGGVTTNWTQSSSGSAWDAAYDIWWDASPTPGNRAATYEMMVWLNWTGTNPIAQTYDASGNAVPFARNVSLGGRTFDVYHRDNVFSFLLTSKSDSISFSIKPLADYAVAQGWMASSVYLISIEAGWEIIKGGTYSTSAYAVNGL